MKKGGLLLLYLLVFAVLFAGGQFYSGYMTSQIDVHATDHAASDLNERFLNMFNEATDVVSFDTTGVEMTIPNPDGTEIYSVVLDESFQVFNGDNKIGVIYVITTHGKYPGMQVAVAILLSTDTIVHVEVLANNETPSYFVNLDDAFFAQFNWFSLNQVSMVIDTISGATYSSVGVETAIKYARLQYAQDYDFVIPVAAMTVNSFTYNFDLATFIASPFVIDILYGENDDHAKLLLDSDYAVTEVLEGTMPDATTLQAIVAYGHEADVITDAYFVSYASDTHILVMETKGNASRPIQITITFNNDFTSILDYQIDSRESYDEEYNDLYIGAAVPAVETYYMDGFVAGDITLDAVAGASLDTSRAMQNLVDLLSLFVNAQTGGE